MIFAVILFLCAISARAQDRPARPNEALDEDPSLLSFDELVTLSSTAKPDGTLAARLDALLATPFVHNGASTAGAEPHRPAVANLGPVLRVVFWNIERGLNFDLLSPA